MNSPTKMGSQNGFDNHGQIRSKKPHLAMGQNPVPPVNIPIPTKIGHLKWVHRKPQNVIPKRFCHFNTPKTSCSPARASESDHNLGNGDRDSGRSRRSTRIALSKFPARKNGSNCKPAFWLLDPQKSDLEKMGSCKAPKTDRPIWSKSANPTPYPRKRAPGPGTTTHGKVGIH